MGTGHSAQPGHCLVCGEPLVGDGQLYWITEHPNGVHHHCRAWETERYPFDRDLDHLRYLARMLVRAWREIVRDGRWLARVRRGWPADARRNATEWTERRARLELHLSRLTERLRL